MTRDITMAHTEPQARSEAATHAWWLSVAVFAACTRGVFEAMFDRTVAYVVQLALICGPLIWILWRSRNEGPTEAPTQRPGASRGFGTVMALALGSCLLTGMTQGTFGPQYLLVLAFTWLLIHFAEAQLIRPSVDAGRLFWASTAVACLLAVVGLLQQVLMFPFELPGYTNLFDVIRPPSLTASYLHYPLVIALAACNCYMAALQGRRAAILPMVLLVVATFASFSRSGMLILFASFTLSMFSGRRQFTWSILGLGVIVGLLLLMSMFIDSEALSVLDRLTSSVDTQSDGNDTRYDIWMTALDRLGPVNLLVGDYFGLVTNSASEDLRDIYGIVESSPLQQVLNIGAIGTVIYYLCFYRLTVALPPRERFARFTVAAAGVQSLFYQSIEVIPYLVMVVITVILAANRPHDQAT